MNIRQPIVWIGVAALVAAFFAVGIGMKQDEKAPARLAAEPDLFPFLKPLDSVRAGVDAAPAIDATEQKQETPEAPVQIFDVEKSARKMRSQGAGEDEIYRMRAAALSPEKAARLAAMEREETAWNARISTYLAQRGKLLGGSGNVAGMAQPLQQLRDAGFTAEEQERLRAYESTNVPQLTLN
jgi:hypothetical protein